MTAIRACNCIHWYQDKICGKGMRVHNWARKALSTGAWRCTVCGNLCK